MKRELRATTWSEPLEGEGSAEFTAFRFYRDLWPGSRTVEDVALELGISNPAITMQACTEWAETFSWDRRAALYDGWRDRKRITRLQEIEDARARLADHEGEIGLSFLKAAKKAGARLEKNAEEVGAGDAIKLAHAARPLLVQDEGGNVRARRLADRLELASDEDLEAFTKLLGKFGIGLDEV